jgi:hypothetical protein
MDFRDILEKIVEQVSLDNVLDPDSVSQELFDLHVEAKLMLKNNPR